MMCILKKAALASAIAMTMSLASPALWAQQAENAGYEHTKITGDWNGARERLYDNGVDLSLGYVGEFAHNLKGGERHKSAYADQWGLNADLDFDKLFGWTGGSFHVSVSNRGGTAPLEQRAGMRNNIQVQEVYGRGKVTRLTNFYLEQNFWGDVLNVKVGRMGVDAGGFGAFGCDFMNLTLCGNLPGNIAGNVWRNWPISQYGVTARVNPNENFYVSAGAFSVNPHDLEPHRHSQPVTKGGWKDTLSVAEVGWHGGMGERQLPGHYRVGAWHSSADAELRDDTGALLDASQAVFNSRSGVYLMMKQWVTQDSHGGGLELFANILSADSRTTNIDRLENAGFFYHAPFAARPDDRIGFAVARVRVSEGGKRAARAFADPVNHQVPSRSEYYAVAHYQAQIFRGAYVMPNIQYIKNAGGFSDSKNIWVFGAKLGLDF